MGEVNIEEEEAATSKSAYGPEDFITEIVRLDKNALEKYFPASAHAQQPLYAQQAQQPLVLGTDTVTSPSVKVKEMLRC